MRLLGSRILLGTAAGLATISVAQAADLPVKARPAAVEYVKVCSLYGAGFYYIPGTDTCLKIGGYLRTQVEWNSAGGGIAVGSNGSSQGRQNRVDIRGHPAEKQAQRTLPHRWLKLCPPSQQVAQEVLNIIILFAERQPNNREAASTRPGGKQGRLATTGRR